MPEKDLIVSVEEHVVTITINREKERNTLNPGLLKGLESSFNEIMDKYTPRVIIIRGAGAKAFSAGFDIRELAIEKGEDFAAESVRILESAFKTVRECQVPVIAMLNGYCIGGGLDLAVNCDFRICHSAVKLGITPAKMGLVYHYAGIQRFLNLIGLSQTRQLFFTGDLINAEKALAIGLVDFAVKEEELESYTYDFAMKLATESAPLAVKGMKSVINMLTGKTNLSEDEENKAVGYMMEAFFSKDTPEAQMAFAQKRKPDFKGE